MPEPVRVGVVGCGAISAAYLRHARDFPILEVVACADLEPERARARAEEFGVRRACPVEEILADPAVEIVLNLTVPKAHAPVALQALAAGKHTYSEKPLAVDRAQGEQVVAAARAAGLRVGCAPDTFLGAGQQTARALVDGGAIGRPVAFTAYTMGPGHESWHPNPEFYYEVGGGPMFDMGPYYLTALLNLLGPVKRLSASATIAIPEREIGSEPKRGKRIRVETPDHLCGTLEFESGAAGTLVTSFATRFPTYDGRFPITLYGTEGTLRVPDPNGFDGPVHLRRAGDSEWRDVAHRFPTGYERSLGLADMATAIRSGRTHRCSLEQSFAVLDAMQGVLDSAASGTAYHPVATYSRPAPLRPDLPFGQLDE